MSQPWDVEVPQKVGLHDVDCPPSSLCWYLKLRVHSSSTRRLLLHY